MAAIISFAAVSKGLVRTLVHWTKLEKLRYDEGDTMETLVTALDPIHR